MRKTAMPWLLTAAFLILIGGILMRLSMTKYETNTYEVGQAFRDISMTTDTADIIFTLSDDGTCKVECYEKENAKHSVTVEHDTLVVRSSRPWYGSIGSGFGSPRITVYLPKAEYDALSIRGSTGNIEIPKEHSFGDVDISLSTGNVELCASVLNAVKIKASTGDICVEDISAGALDLSVTTGKVTVSRVTCREDITVGVTTGQTRLTDISCESLTSSGTTGGISLRNVIAADGFSIERSTGNVEFSRCDAGEIYVKTTTGDVTGSLLSDKVFIADTNTGSVDVPKTGTGGRCEIGTHTGDIRIRID